MSQAEEGRRQSGGYGVLKETSLVERSPPVLPSPKVCEERRKWGSTDSAFARQLQEAFDSEVAEKEAKERFTCEICFEEYRLECGVTLDCGHVACTECLSGYLQVKVREKCVSEQELICPMPKCGCPINDFQVLGVLEGTSLADRFLSTRAEHYRPEAPGERKCQCPCGEVIIVMSAAEQGLVTCPSCKEQVCFRCQERHPGVTCAAYWQWRKDNEQVDEAFEELMSSERWLRCPECDAPCSRSYGCNYMTCGSVECRNKGGTNFCYICGVKLLNKTEHFTHYPHGMFSDYCLNKPKVNDGQKTDFWLELWRMMQGLSQGTS
ncbi:Probable E3 ubiquitin-protein ligase ARI10 (ARIADNE-like protein ARI10) (Protein ariadne homolog 10) (RING-type E3 ubiquitin transferase ARI10) [Durusdinium trenchii]|uniref:RBR-type E3 ubiquitin transferase n=1 Tax=Durusdinium trenchii TaxID=1381693 RepID=A0ABP0LNU7_9DINO